MSPIFGKIGVQYIDHVAVTCAEMMPTLADYLAIPGSRLLRGPLKNESRQIEYAFISLSGAGIIEIMSPLTNVTSFQQQLTENIGLNHFCYAVDDIHQAINIAINECQASVVSPCSDDELFDYRGSAFLTHPQHGLFMLLSTQPKALTQQIQKLPLATAPIEQNVNDNQTSMQLLAVFNRVFDTTETNIETINMTEFPQWDSFKHLVLTMEVEKEFEINIDVISLANITQLKQFKTFI